MVDIPNNAKFASFDVKNLFSSIPPLETVEIIQNKLLSNKSNPLIAQDIINLLKICLEQNYFQFNNTIYNSQEGLIMGNPLSPLLAEIFMNKLEGEIEQQEFF